MLDRHSTGNVGKGNNGAFYLPVMIVRIGIILGVKIRPVLTQKNLVLGMLGLVGKKAIDNVIDKIGGLAEMMMMHDFVHILADKLLGTRIAQKPQATAIA